MNCLFARNPKQLDICLRLLYAERMEFELQVCENEKKKIFYRISVLSTEERYLAVKEMYRVMIS